MNKHILCYFNKFTLKDWLDYIQKLSSKSIDLNLDRIREIAIILNLLHFKSYIILIGGTNGKGTTCCLLESILLKNKIKVGLYTSPHLLSYKERIRVCGAQLPDNIYVEAISAIESVRNNIKLTYFEFVTLSALYIFKKFKLDVIILEVGLGGRLDATNVVDPDISAITNIAIDHVDFLGSTRDKIAFEKVGIFRANKIAVIGEVNYPVTVDRIAQYQNTVLFSRGRHWDFCIYKDKWCWWDQNYYKFLYNLPIPIIPLENAAVALSILYWLPFPIFRKSICFGLQNAMLLGRFQIINYRPLIVLDVGHNPHAADYIVKRLSLIVVKTGIVRVVIGMLKNKDIKSTICCLSSLVDVWYCANLNTSLSANITQLSDYFINRNVQYFDNIMNAWKQAIIDSHYDDCVLVFGSFYAVSPIMQLLINGDEFKFNIEYKFKNFFVK